MRKRRILICDDDIDASRDWAQRLDELPHVKKQFVVEPCETNDLVSGIEKLARRRERLRNSDDDWGDRIVFDELDILVIDFDLQDKDPRSGREIAYLARCFSKCGLIISLNEHGPSPFDLTLTEFTDSFADLNIGAHQLSNPGLWKEPWDGFRPWAWPLIPKALRDFETRISSLESSLDRPIFEFLGLSDLLPHFSRPIVEFISGAKRSKVSDITFRDFVCDSPNGLKYKDKKEIEFGDDMLCRIAAARLSHWLERLVLPGQHILVDAPHLVSRFPSLLGGKLTEKSLNKTAGFGSPGKLGIRDGLSERNRFSREGWLSRQAWLWPEVSSDESISEVKDPWSAKTIDFAFCEDLSAFLPKNEAREFVADVASPFVKRYLVDPDIDEEHTQHQALVQSIREQQISFLPSNRLAY